MQPRQVNNKQENNKQPRQENSILDILKPFSISKLEPYTLKRNPLHSDEPKTVYNVSNIPQVKGASKQFEQTLKEQYPNHSYTIYTKNATSGKLCADMMVHRIKFSLVFKEDSKIAVNLRLLGAEVVEPKKEAVVETVEPKVELSTLEDELSKGDEDLSIEHLNEAELQGLRYLIAALVEAAEEKSNTNVLSLDHYITTDDDMLLVPQELERQDAITE